MSAEMNTSFESKSDRTDLDTEEIPTNPDTKKMREWNKWKVLNWIRKRAPDLLDEDDVKIFERERIFGRSFLVFTIEHFQSYGLSLAVAAALKNLADEVKKEDKLSDQTVGGKRKGNDTDASEPSISSKRIHQENLFWEESATRARERRKLVREIITGLNSPSNQHSNSVYPLPRAVDKLCDPTFEHKLAFPFIGMVPERFKIDDKVEQNWPYVGRIMFRKLLEELKMVRESGQYTAVWLYGTPGYGKSHLLAVLVCYLAAQDERVVYIPDCREWLQDPVEYLKDAMLFAWADDITTQEKINTLITEAEIDAFFERQKNVLFVGDQLNALRESNSPSEEMKYRANLYRWLMRFTSDHTAVFSSSANYREFIEKSEEQTSNRVVPAYGGLERTEMDQWWKRHKIDMGGYKRSDVEDATGCIPFLLEKCVVDGKIDLTVKDLRDIYNSAVGFVRKIKTKTEGYPLRWEWYVDYVTACFRQRSRPSGQSFDLIDHRYFYNLNGSGRCVCGLVRDAVGDQLLQWGDNFIDSNSLASLPDLINSPSAVGFMIKHAVLSSIRSNGLAINAGIMRPMKVRLLTEPSDIKTDIRDEPVLYWPERFNFETIDGIIILINPEELNDEKNAKKIAQKIAKKKKTPQGTRMKNAKVKRDKLLMFPLQITTAPAGHSDSHEKFFKDYHKWTKHLSHFDVETQFIWITPSDRSFQTHRSISNRPAHGERYIPFEDVSKEIWRKYQYAKEVADATRVDLTGCSTASDNITADERSSSSSEVTAAASSAGRVFGLRSGRRICQT